ncbi:site-2 protease family protein [Desulfomonile tiedjei]|uniref:Zinc metalloprotease n=1 Tax=Desulfomonile tiedjei (strain ATCC 49306 / DSM 6799 / DCB-1) TaxID=706587 RepID=I4C496_DESTA|nr:site-2 protease family protein [Desulfomonile tiedjei]AFM24387.1 Zn-dependent protease [Desulfomonile tiedjei DSM 6799]
MRWSFRIGSIMGIPVKVHLTFVLLLILIYFVGVSVIGIGGLAGVVFVVLVFASVVFHELSHSLVARHYGIEVVDITLLPIGGVARMPNPPENPTQEILISVAGPAASMILGFSLWFFAELFGTGVSLRDLSVEKSLLAQLAAVNFVLAIFNLLPAFPMDGGRILRGFLALYLSKYTATRIAVGVGQVFAILLFFLGIFTMNFFMLLIALFVYLGAEAEERYSGIMLSLGEASAGAAMITHIEAVSPDATLGDLAALFTRGFQSDFPVVDDRRLVGLVTRDMLVNGLHEQGPSAPITSFMIKDFATAVEDTPLTEVFHKMQNTGIRAVPVLRGGELKGLVTLEQIGRYNMLCSGYSCEFLHPGKSSKVVAQ